MMRLLALAVVILMKPVARIFDGRLSALRRRLVRWAREDQRQREQDRGPGQGSRG